MSMPITQHFTLDEMKCHSGEPYPVDEIDEDDPEKRSWYFSRLLPLCNALEAIRAACGGLPMTILSGYRTESYNDGLRNSDGSGTGVSKNSMHIQGKAADITIEDLTPLEVHTAILALVSQGKLTIGGLGIYARWVHVDIRQQVPAGHLARWNG